MTSRTALAFASCVLAALVAPLSPALGQIPAGRMSVADGYAKDFALVKRAGLFHVFFIESGPTGDGNYLGHQTSPDLYHWTREPNVLVADRGGWNADFVWAPSIVEKDGRWWMFYTGVRARPPGACPGAPFQQIGVATSPDLDDWTLAPDSWLDPLEVPWSLQPRDSCLYGTFGSFRDPHVVWDPETGQWVMLYVTIPSPDSTSANVPHPGAYDPNRYVIGLGKAPAAFAADSDWTNLGALWITHAAYPNGTGITTWESPHAFSRTYQGQRLWFLFASAGATTSVGGVSFLTGPSLTLSRFEKKGRAGWTWRGPIDNLQIVDSYGHANRPFGWFASEYLKDPETGLEYFADVHVPDLEFRQIKWRATSDGFDLDPPFAVVGLDPRPAVSGDGLPIDLIVRSLNARDGAGSKARALEVLSVNETGDSVGTLAPAQVGLPDTVVITDDEIHVGWSPRIVDASPLRVRVRLAAPSREVQSPMVTIWGKTRPSGIDSPGASHDASRRPASPEDRTRLGVAAGPTSRPGLSFHLAQAGVARLTLFDLEGRRVRGLLDRELPAGTYAIAWDAANDGGERLPRGVYFARLDTRGGSCTARVVLIGR